MTDTVGIVTAVAVCAAAVAAAATRLLAPAYLARRGRRTAAPPAPDGLAALYVDGQVDALDYATCPHQHRRTPHALRADRSRRCWECGCETPGETP